MLGVAPHHEPAATLHLLMMQELLRARHITMAQVGRLEEAWKSDAAATLDTLSQPSPDEEPAPVALKCGPSHPIPAICAWQLHTVQATLPSYQMALCCSWLALYLQACPWH